MVEERHTLSIEPRSIPRLFTWIHMYPSLAMQAVDFGPDMVFGIPDPSHPASDSAAEHTETVRPFTNTSSSCLQQDKGIVVSWESFERLALGMRALVQLDSICASGCFIRERCRHASRNGWRPTRRAKWVIHPFEEVALEPLQQSANNAILVTPSG